MQADAYIKWRISKDLYGTDEAFAGNAAYAAVRKQCMFLSCMQPKTSPAIGFFQIVERKANNERCTQ
jgi:hypothetical protein